MEATMSSLPIFLLTRFCTSVLENTPHREAMGYTRVDFRAKASISSTSMPNNEAIWSIKAPVPPAQLPFMRMSAPPAWFKYTTLASSPPMSMTVVTPGYRPRTARTVAETSCTNGIPCRSASPMPTEPVTAILALPCGRERAICEKISCTQPAMSARWRR